MSSERFIPILHPCDAVHAGLVRSAMEEAGIVCYVDNENMASVRGGMGIGIAQMSVMVPENQKEQALGIIQALELD